MEEKHYIQWIEVISGGSLFVQGLEPGQKLGAPLVIVNYVNKKRQVRYKLVDIFTILMYTPLCKLIKA